MTIQQQASKVYEAASTALSIVVVWNSNANQHANTLKAIHHVRTRKQAGDAFVELNQSMATIRAHCPANVTVCKAMQTLGYALEDLDAITFPRS